MKKIAAIITAIIVTACLAFSISAETLTPEAIESLKETGEDVAVIGKIVAGDRKVVLK